MRNQKMQASDEWSPGVWSTDGYIRAWARSRARSEGTFSFPLQSLHGRWMARVRLDLPGEPVERIDLARCPEPCAA